MVMFRLVVVGLPGHSGVEEQWAAVGTGRRVPFGGGGVVWDAKAWPNEESLMSSQVTVVVRQWLHGEPKGWECRAKQNCPPY